MTPYHRNIWTRTIEKVHACTDVGLQSRRPHPSRIQALVPFGAIKAHGETHHAILSH